MLSNSCCGFHLVQENDMTSSKPDLVLVGPQKAVFTERLAPVFDVHPLNAAKDRDAFFAEIADRARAIAVTYSSEKVSAEFMSRLPKLEIVSSFGVGYDHVDAKWAGAHGIIVTNTPDVLNEEVADTALGLLLCTVRELPQGERYLRAGKWEQKAYPLSPATLRDRTVGMVGMGRIGRAIAKRLDAFGVPVVYHSRRAQAGVAYRHYPDLVAMARDVDVLLVIVPGGAETRNMINATVLEALGPDGILINIARGSVVDEPALIAALRDKKIRAAGLDVFVNEPRVPKELMEMDNVVLLPHLGSASVYTRAQMDHLVVDNLLSWAAGRGPLTPVPEAPPKK
jgi:lactate dehydrogenase-like 2-hydroxyacid dehydrogenase